MLITVHINPKLPHQVEHGEWFKAGFRRHGIKCDVTHDRTAPSDVHIVSGPYYAKNVWLNHPRVILLDRCYYKGDPEHVSLGWMDSNGDRVFHKGFGRKPPKIAHKTSGNGTIFIADYDGPVDNSADYVRLHPAAKNYNESLIEALRPFKKAIGYKTTALVTAALEGLEIECRHKNHILNQKNWLELLPYADWHGNEIANGLAWEHLRQCL